MAVIADRCPEIQVHVVDLNTQRVAAWNDSDLTQLPVYEPGLDAVVARARGRNLRFSTEVDAAIASADMVFLSVNTPTKTRGIGAGQASDLRWIEACTRQVAAAAKSHTIVVEKSTLPVRTAEAVQTILSAAQGEGKSFSVLSNPEFLAEGTAISDLEAPDRVLIGGNDAEAAGSAACSGPRASVGSASVDCRTEPSRVGSRSADASMSVDSPAVLPSLHTVERHSVL